MFIYGQVEDQELSSSLSVYQRFKAHLSNLGFTLYPGEFDCVYSDHPLVDIAAKMGSYYWAFEYKSENDSISRGVEQVKSYSNWFDYVVLVSEKNLDHRKSENYWKLRRMGAGIWVYDPESDQRFVKASPLIHSPDHLSRKLVARRFRAFERFCKDRSDCYSNFQSNLSEYVQS